MAAKNNFFGTSHLKKDLKRHAVRGGLFTAAGQFAGKAIRVVSIVVLSRLLDVEDFGLIAMITAVTGFMLVYSDLGLSLATIQRSEITHQQVSNLFWINVALGALFTIVGVILAPILVWVYDEPRLFWLTIVLSTGFIFTGLTIQHQALIQRQLRFGVLSLVNFASPASGVVVGVVSAFLGAGIWALVYQQLAHGLVRFILVWIVCQWRPDGPVRDSGVKGMLTFGGYLSGFNALNYASRNVDKFLMGWWWGAGPLGLYNRAYELLLMPIREIINPISRVAYPTLSRLQGEPERYSRYYLKALSLIVSITMPGIMFLVVMSDETIRLVLGAKWVEAGRIFAVMGVAALIQPFLSTTMWLYVSSGQTKRMFKWGLISSCCVIVSFVLGLPYGGIGVAASYTICTLILVIPSLWYSTKMTPVNLSDIFDVMWRPVIATLAVGVALMLLKSHFPESSVGITGLLTGFVCTIVVYFGVSCGLHLSLQPITELIDVAMHLRRSR